MSDYTKTTNFTAKDSTQAVILGSEHDAEFNAIAASIGTKMNKIASPTADQLLTMNASGEAVDSGHSKVEIPIYGTPEALGTSYEKTKTLTGTVEEVEINFYKAKTNSVTAIRCCLGTGSALDITGYYTGAESSSVNRYSNAGVGFYLSAVDGAGVDLNGTIRLRRAYNNIWVMTAAVYNSGVGAVYNCTGHVTLAGALDIVGIRVDGAADTLVTGGYWRVNYRRSA